jgi:hypothetical protein
LHSTPNIIIMIKSRRRWVRHVERMGSWVMLGPYTSVGRPEEKRPFGRRK